MPSRRYSAWRPVKDAEHMSLTEISEEIGRSQAQTRKLLHKFGWIGIRRAHGVRPRTITYPTESVEMLKEMLGQPNRHQEPSWFDDFLKGQTDD